MSMIRDAAISECGCYRYELTRRWDVGPTLEFFMLNPSTADALQDDPTIRRCIGFGKRWGFGALVVHNLFAWRATNPLDLIGVQDPIGPENRKYLEGNGTEPDCTVAAWGAHPLATGWWNGYPQDITPALKGRRLICLGTTKSGAPKHPLYVKSDTIPREWTP
jgi:hypothetical protein